MVSASASFTGPQYYNDLLGPICFDTFAADLVRRFPKRPPGDVLEIACGTGLVTRRLRERLSPSLRLVATDLSKAMLDYARAQLDGRRGIEWREADALKLPFEDKEFGAVVCGFGMMFVPDRQAALREAIAEVEGAPAAPAAPALSGDQMTAVRGMVAGLAERLKTHPDDPEGWVRLVRAYAVLGETAKREAALKDASTRYAKRPDILDQLSKAASAEPMR